VSSYRTRRGKLGARKTGTRSTLGRGLLRLQSSGLWRSGAAFLTAREVAIRFDAIGGSARRLSRRSPFGVFELERRLRRPLFQVASGRRRAARFSIGGARAGKRRVHAARATALASLRRSLGFRPFCLVPGSFGSRRHTRMMRSFGRRHYRTIGLSLTLGGLSVSTRRDRRSLTAGRG
jgi:hypothetical protein